MQLDYLAHSCFSLSRGDRKVVFDPYDSSLGYPLPSVFNADYVLVSHDHSDHNAVSSVSGPTQVIRGAARRSFGGLEIEGRLARHGTDEDSDWVVLFRLDWDGFSIAHLGDLGEPLCSENLEFLSALDILMVPVGGGHALAPDMAAELVRQVRPSIVVPMHFMTPYLAREDFPNFQDVQAFLEACRSDFPIEYYKDGRLRLDDRISPGSSSRICVLTHQMG